MQGLRSSLSTRLRHVTSELRAINLELKSEHVMTDKGLLQEFRQTIDDVRFTAWTVSELMNARDSHRNQQALTSFLTAERIRRLSDMVGNLCAEMGKESVNTQTAQFQNLPDSLAALQERLAKLIKTAQGQQRDGG